MFANIKFALDIARNVSTIIKRLEAYKKKKRGYHSLLLIPLVQALASPIFRG